METNTTKLERNKMTEDTYISIPHIGIFPMKIPLAPVKANEDELNLKFLEESLLALEFNFNNLSVENLGIIEKAAKLYLKQYRK
jgi:hypothetical protein